MVKQAWNNLSALSAGRRALLLLVVGASLIHFGVGSWRAAARGFADLHLFLHRSFEFSRTGVLYPDADNAEVYAPASRVYKFPPLFAMILLPQVRGGIPERIYLVHWIVQLLLYVAAILVLLAALAPWRRPRALVWFVVLALNFVPFFETLWRLQLETPILVLIALALWFDRKRLPYLAGAALGVATMLKVYPVFLLGWFIVRRCGRGLAGALAAMLAIGALGWWVIGAEQNHVYFTVILPRMLRETALITPENVSLAKPLASLAGFAPQVAKRLAQGLALAAVSAGYLLLLREPGSRRAAIDPALSLALFVCAMLLFIPNAWTNYLVLLLLPFGVILSRLAPGDARGSWGAACAAFTFFLTLFYTPCGQFREGIPCTQDPPFLAFFHWPRWFHDLMIEWKVLAVGALVAAWFAVARSRD